MDVEKRLALIREVGAEIIAEDELRKLLETKKKITAYDGFEPSGNIHIAQGILRAINVEKLMSAKIDFTLYIADWFAYLNGKLGGNIENIRIAGEYFLEVWKAAGIDTNKINVVWASDHVKNGEYWEKVLKIAANSTVNRVIRCSQIMGRTETEIQHASQIFYPCMQAADIFHMNIDIAQLGMDQRKVNVFAREMGEKLKWYKPIAVHHHMLMGLGEPPKGLETGAERAIALKMSKSKPESAIFMTDSEEDVTRKINNAYCPAKQVEENPILEYCKYIVFEKFDKLEVKRPEKYGGDLIIKNYDDLVKEFQKENGLHPMDLKKAVAVKINELLNPIRTHFEKNKKAKELLEKVRSFEVTR